MKHLKNKLYTCKQKLCKAFTDETGDFYISDAVKIMEDAQTFHRRQFFGVRVEMIEMRCNIVGDSGKEGSGFVDVLFMNADRYISFLDDGVARSGDLG